MFTGRIPFDDIRHEGQLYGRINQGFRPERPADAAVLGLSDSIWSSMTKAWSPDPQQRPTLVELNMELLSQVPESSTPLICEQRQQHTSEMLTSAVRSVPQQLSQFRSVSGGISALEYAVRLVKFPSPSA